MLTLALILTAESILVDLSVWTAVLFVPHSGIAVVTDTTSHITCSELIVLNDFVGQLLCTPTDVDWANANNAGHGEVVLTCDQHLQTAHIT